MSSIEYVLVLLEPTTIESIRSGGQKINFSHDWNTLQLAQAAINLGAEVRCADYLRQTETVLVHSAWPEIKVSLPRSNSEEKYIPTSIISANYLAFANSHMGPLSRKKYITKILIQAAIHPIEQPDFFYPIGTAIFINVIRQNVNFVITQNDRMKDLLYRLLGLLVGLKNPDRILISKLVPEIRVAASTLNGRLEARKKLGIDSDSIVILNAGGAWKWTQFNEFLSAFASLPEAIASKFIILQPALGNVDNKEHQEYHLETLHILKGMKSNIRNRVLIGDTWELGKDGLKPYFQAADFGLNLNLETIENWQSYRVRMVEYLENQLPCIVSKGSFWDQEDVGKGILFLGHNRDDFSNLFQELFNESKNLKIYKRRVKDITEYAKGLSISEQAESVLTNIFSNPQRFETFAVEPTSLWSFSKSGGFSAHSKRNFFRTLYFRILSNRVIYEFFVSIGLRALIRRYRNKQN